MKSKRLWVGMLVAAVVLAALAGGTYAATPEQIDQSIVNGVAWLANAQDPISGSWGGDNEPAAHTCFALVKLEERAYDLDYESPFDPSYEYANNVVMGWHYLFANHISVYSPLGVQWHGGVQHDPDTNGNGYGLYFNNGHPNYTTGICLMALAASGTPDRMNDAGSDFDGDGSADTFLEIAQEAVDWMALAQGDSGWCEGGWGYGANDNACDWSDQSNSGYSVLGLAYAEDLGCTVPAWVRTELNLWTAAIQNADGGAGYQPGGGSNLLRTGNLAFQLCFKQEGPGNTPFDAALGYIENTWLAMNNEPGWGYGQNPANYQAMYCLMKGLEYCGVNEIDYDGDGQLEDWFNQEPPASPPEDLASVLVQQQDPTGVWPRCDWGDDVLCTTWALLTLERFVPPPPVIEVFVDIKPGSCPNSFNSKDKGVLPVAVLGTADFDVTTIDPATIRLTREGYEQTVAPLRWSYYDPATPFEGELCGCHDLDGDGYLDLALKFSVQEVKAAFSLVGEAGKNVVLTVQGNLYEANHGTPIAGSDCVRVLK